MLIRKKKKEKQRKILPEKMAILAEQGLKAAKLTKQEKITLLRDGLQELYELFDFTGQSIPPLEPEAVDAIMRKFFTPKLRMRICKKNIEVVEAPARWLMGGPAFAHRGRDIEGVSFNRRVGKLTIHLNIKSRDERLADIRIRITDDSGKGRSSFEVKLFKEEKCVETLSSAINTTVSLFALERGDYLLRVYDKKGEIVSVPLKIE